MEKPTKEEIAKKYGLAVWMTAEEACIYLNVSMRHLDEECKRGTLNPSKPGRDRRFDPKEIEAFLKRKVEKTKTKRARSA